TPSRPPSRSTTSRPRSSRRGKRRTPFSCNGANASDKLAPLPRRSSARAGEAADAAGCSACDALSLYPPPCGEGRPPKRSEGGEVGVVRLLRGWRPHYLTRTPPTPNPSPQRGGEQTERAGEDFVPNSAKSQGDLPSPMLLRVTAAG